MISILYDNTALDNFKADWGFACLIGDSILFDTGAKPDILDYNIEKMNIDTKLINKVVISHKHWDHTGSLEHINNSWQNIEKIYTPSDFDFDVEKAEKNSGETNEIASDIFIMPELKSEYKSAKMMEQSLVIQSDKGILLITGCAHPGIVDIVTQAKQLFPDQSISVIGGFHLGNHSEDEIRNIAMKLKELGVDAAGPTHCSGDIALKVFAEVFGKDIIELGVGRRIEFGIK